MAAPFATHWRKYFVVVVDTSSRSRAPLMNYTCSSVRWGFDMFPHPDGVMLLELRLFDHTLHDRLHGMLT